MTNVIEVGLRIALIGAGATVMMDLWLALLKKLNVPTMNFALLGRWVGHLTHGTFLHAGIATSSPIRNELTIGWLAHYAIGIAFSTLLVVIVGISWINETIFIPALLVGVATVVAPLFIMQPAMGSGIASIKTATPLRNCVKSLINHIVFGCGLYVAAKFLQWFL